MKHNNSTEKDPHLAEMKHELNDKILKITTEIKDYNPELLPYLDEMPITIPSEDDPDMSVQQLQSHYDSLVSILKEYKAKQPKKEQ